VLLVRQAQPALLVLQAQQALLAQLGLVLPVRQAQLV
jgi:hypothetical protein